MHKPFILEKYGASCGFLTTTEILLALAVLFCYFTYVHKMVSFAPPYTALQV